jgi:18S rRNA (guanine1575-N7)-methyltransferase
MSRPELTGHASIFYNAKEAKKYDSSSRMIGVQREITERAIELLRLPSASEKPSYILDVGCGSGLSGKVLEEQGHVWVGCDVSRDMLEVANERIEQKRLSAMGEEGDDGLSSSSNEEDDDNDADMQNSSTHRKDASFGDLMHHDMGTGLPFRPATFDACISISALQWLCYSNAKDQIPKKRLTRFFSSLYQVLRRGGRAVLQFYPETAEQAVLISECAAKVGFAGGVVVDYPNSAKAKKHYLVLTFERGYKAPVGLSDTGLNQVRVDGERRDGNKKVHKKKKNGKTKEWILQKKETQRRKGKDVRQDTKFTGRKRKDKF